MMDTIKKNVRGILILLAAYSVFAFAAYPQITNHVVNISESINEYGNEDFVPEMIIDGNTIHTVWSRYVSGSEAYLYYSRSLDSGDSWESPVLIWQFSDGAQSKEVTSLRLAVSGSYVYACFAEYDYNDNGTGKLYLAKSTNSGGSFGTPVELVNSGGGYAKIPRSFIKADGSNVAVTYEGDGAKEGIHSLFSTDNGASFSESVITQDANNLSDFWYDGEQMIVVHEYAYFYYGLHTGRVYVSVSNNNGTSFTTSDVTVRYVDENQDQREKCRCYHDSRYVPKISRDGNNIHLIYTGHNSDGLWTILYARSSNSGQSFESPVDINKGLIGDAQLQAGQEGLVAKGGKVYMDYLATSGKVYLVRSDDSGATSSEPEDLLPMETHYIKTTWWPQLVIDQTDETGNTVYFGGGPMMIRKSTDGGQNFGGTLFLFPLLESPDVQGSFLRIDDSGIPHWLGKGRWHFTHDYDIYYAKKAAQPEPGEENKSLSIETIYNQKKELVIVPSSPSIEFDSVMTAESWIKITDGTSSKFNVFGKVNGYDGDNYQPSGYQMTIHNSGSIRYLNTGIQTDKGQFINWTGGSFTDTLWHHIAFTYDANAGLNNFKTYFDGLLVLEQTVTGAIIPGDGLLMIGSRQNFYLDNKYQIDDIRLWDRALSQEELLENQLKTFTGEEEGLKLYLNFDDTFKDMSGNGNDAVPLYLGDLVTSNFDPPITGFEMYKAGKTVSFNNTTTNATSYLWNFGNDGTSEQGNPIYSYGTPGEYDISLTAKNDNSVTSAADHASIEGLDRIEPTSAGNYGSTFISVYGGGLTVEGSSVVLRREGYPDVIGSNLGSPSLGILKAFFDLNNLELGKWDVVVKNGESENILTSAFEVVPAILPNTWVNFTGRGTLLTNTWTTQTINYGNSGNIDAFFVPVFITISNNGSLEVELIDFGIENFDFLPELYEEDGTISGTEIFDGVEKNTKTIAFIIPVVEANSSHSVHVRVKSDETFRVRIWDTKPLINNDAVFSEYLKSAEVSWKQFGQCLGLAAIDEGIQFFLGKWIASKYAVEKFAGCFVAGGKEIISMLFQNKSWTNRFLGVAGVTIDCLEPVAAEALKKIGKEYIAKNAILVAKGLLHIYSCWNTGEPSKATFLDLIRAIVNSFDPNEMIGPPGFGDNNYIAKNNTVPYTILFENKSSATAPAHIVTIVDSLDTDKYDLNDFGFSSFGWGDTILSPAGSRSKEFAMDIDLRPLQNLITRVAGKADIKTGVIKWEFWSLNPETMNLEEDPFIGFLPPNNTSPEGEGFVSFSVGLKDELGTDDQVRNKASIVFDANEAIITNEYVNTFDLDPPTSKVDQIELEISSPFQVSWAGSDEGSGIRDYSVYVMVNDTALIPWRVNTTDVSGDFMGEIGSIYKFYSIATDNVSHIEDVPGTYDAQTTIVVGIDEFNLVKDELSLFPNPITDRFNVKMENAPWGVYVVEVIGMNGQRFHSEIYDSSSLSRGIEINVEDCSPGNYVLRIIYGNKSVTRKILVQ